MVHGAARLRSDGTVATWGESKASFRVLGMLSATKSVVEAGFPFLLLFECSGDVA